MYSLIQKAEYGRVCSVLKNYYNGSLVLALQTCFPDHAWKPWKFAVLPRSLVDSLKIPREELREHLEKTATTQLHIKRLDDWYRISQDQLRAVDLFRLVLRYQGLSNLLADAYPDHPWEASKFSLRNKKSEQRILHEIVAELFPNEPIQEEFKTGSDVTFERSNYRMDVDIYLPGLNLGIEYHGTQHYHDTYHFGQCYQRRRADIEKIQKCSASGITIVELPYWVPLTSGNVANHIVSKRPELADKCAVALKRFGPLVDLPPVEALPPIKPKHLISFQRFRKCQIVTLEEARSMPLSNYYVGTMQAHGIRFQWLPSSRQFISRSGYDIKAPVTFLDRLPNVPFEGVLMYECVCRDEVPSSVSHFLHRFSDSNSIHITMESLFNQTNPQWDRADFIALDLLESVAPFPTRQQNLRALGCRTVEFVPHSAENALRDGQVLVEATEPYQPTSKQLLRLSAKHITFARFARADVENQMLVLQTRERQIELPMRDLHLNCVPGEVFELAHDGSTDVRNVELGRQRPEKSWDSIILAQRLSEGSRLGTRNRHV
jgi:hypothetical protein